MESRSTDGAIVPQTDGVAAILAQNKPCLEPVVTEMLHANLWSHCRVT